MSKNREGRFYEGVERKLPADVYREGMANPYRRGTPDRYYEGPGGALWVEYKYIDPLPSTLKSLSAHQQRWLRRAYEHGVRVAVIVGTKNGGLWLPGLQWQEPLEHKELKTKDELADLIQDEVLHGHPHSRRRSSYRRVA